MAMVGPHWIVSHFISLLNKIHVLGFLFQIASLCLFINVLMFHLYEYYSFDHTYLVSSLIVCFLCR